MLLMMTIGVDDDDDDDDHHDDHDDDDDDDDDHDDDESMLEHLLILPSCFTHLRLGPQKPYQTSNSRISQKSKFRVCQVTSFPIHS